MSLSNLCVDTKCTVPVLAYKYVSGRNKNNAARNWPYTLSLQS